MLKLKFCGHLPQQFDAAIRELSSELGISPDAEGLLVNIAKGDHLQISLQDSICNIIYFEPVQLYRALSLLVQLIPQGNFQREEYPCFETVGIMFDVSRNAVLKPETIKYFLRKMSIMGLNLGMMYTEDTYEIKGRPYFGHLRGRYSFEELKELDDYAFMFGIELCPCIQTLGHLERVLHWPAMQHLKDTEEVLCAGEEQTYLFIEEMLVSASAPYRSKRIHIGMDEAWDLGLGRYRLKNGFVPGFDIISNHLARVRELVSRHGLNAMMWSDMYFRLASPTNGYYNSNEIPTEVIAKAPADVDLVYWDYYHEKEEEYDAMFAKHQLFAAKKVFAGALWTWTGPAPDYDKAFRTTIPGLKQSQKWGIKTVLATAWGDNGAESNLLTTILGLQLYAEFNYTGDCNSAWLSSRFSTCVCANAESFLDLSLFNKVPGMKSGATRPVNAAKFLLYQDPLIQLFEKDTEGLDMSSHYLALHKKYLTHRIDNPDFFLLFDFYATLAKALALKCEWHQNASTCVREKNLQKAAEMAHSVTNIINTLEELRAAWRTLWFSTNKPYGFEIIDLRLGGLAARVQSAGIRMQSFAQGEISDIEELSTKALNYTTLEDGCLNGSYAWGEIVSSCKINI